MSSIVIALPKIEDAKKIRSVLERHGFTVASVCSTASSALSNASELGSGVLICGPVSYTHLTLPTNREV